MSFSDHFSSMAAQYAAFRPGYPKELFAWLASLAEGHDLAWDCATGSGQAATGLAPHFARVIATDASAEQIKNASTDPKIEYHVALAEKSGLDAQSADLITVAQAVHWFKHDEFYAEVRRVIKPRGILALWTYEFFSVDDEKVKQCMRRFYKEIVAPYWPPERAYVKDHYRTLPFPFADEITAPPFDERFSWNFAQMLGYFRSWSASKRYREQRGEDPVTLVEPELAALWGDPQSMRTITMPIYMRVARI